MGVIERAPGRRMRWRASGRRAGPTGSPCPSATASAGRQWKGHAARPRLPRHRKADLENHLRLPSVLWRWGHGHPLMQRLRCWGGPSSLPGSRAAWESESVLTKEARARHTAHAAPVIGPWGVRNPVQVLRSPLSMCYVHVTAQGLKARSADSSRGDETRGTFCPRPYYDPKIYVTGWQRPDGNYDLLPGTGKGQVSAP